MKKIIAIILTISAVLTFSGCSQINASAAEDLMTDIKSVEVAGKAPDNDFVNAQMNFGVELFKESYKIKSSENVLISPLSAMAALAMTANGAKGQTLEEMEALLGGDMTIDQLNEYLKYYLNSLKTADEDGFKLHTANSVWFRDDDENLTVEKDFLQTNASYYDAEIYKAPFDNSTVKKINDWVSKNTDKMIPKIIEELKPEDIMCLINALAFDAEWEKIYDKEAVVDDTFTAESGEEQKSEMMYSKESVYLEDLNATGFKKYYKGGKFSFAALLPNEGISLGDYIDSLTAEELMKILSEAEGCEVNAGLPKFKYEYGTGLNNPLINMGIPTAFDVSGADFSKLGKCQEGNINIGYVIQKTFIEVNERGTKAGAATAVMMTDGAMPMSEPKEVILNRPFIYMIVDNDTNLPIFIGAVNSIN